MLVVFMYVYLCSVSLRPYWLLYRQDWTTCLTVTCRDHVQLGQELDCVDFDTAAEVSGSKFVYLKRAAALLELALVNYAMQKVVSKGFIPLMTPDLVRESVLEKCGFQPRGSETQVGHSVQNSWRCMWVS